MCMCVRMGVKLRQGELAAVSRVSGQMQERGRGAARRRCRWGRREWGGEGRVDARETIVDACGRRQTRERREGRIG